MEEDKIDQEKAVRYLLQTSNVLAIARDDLISMDCSSSTENTDLIVIDRIKEMFKNNHAAIDWFINNIEGYFDQNKAEGSNDSLDKIMGMTGGGEGEGFNVFHKMQAKYHLFRAFHFCNAGVSWERNIDFLLNKVKSLSDKGVHKNIAINFENSRTELSRLLISQFKKDKSKKYTDEEIKKIEKTIAELELKKKAGVERVKIELYLFSLEYRKANNWNGSFFYKNDKIKEILSDAYNWFCHDCIGFVKGRIKFPLQQK